MDPTACPQFGPDIVYIGELDNFGRQNGEGQIVFADGSEYKGAFKAGKRDGSGRYRYGKDGPIYEGEWNSDKLCEFSMEEHFKKSSGEGKVDNKMEENQFTNKSGEDKEEVEDNSYSIKERIIKEEEEELSTSERVGGECITDHTLFTHTQGSSLINSTN